MISTNAGVSADLSGSSDGRFGYVVPSLSQKMLCNLHLSCRVAAAECICYPLASPFGREARRTVTSLEIETVQSRRRDPGLSLSHLPVPWIVSLRTAFLLFRFHHMITYRAVSVSP